MTVRNQDYKRGHADGLRAAVAWLHKRANEMNDPHAKAILNGAAFNLGLNNKRGPALSCPDGFRLVPVEPTTEMLKAYSVGLKNYISTFDAAERQARWGSPKKGRGFELPEWEKAIARYRAMLAASPAPAPQPISQDQDRG